MNENLEELYAEAYLWAVNELRGTAEDVALTDNFGELVTMKFSSLIIHRCMDLCESIASGRDAEAIQEGIAKHFGIIS